MNKQRSLATLVALCGSVAFALPAFAQAGPTTQPAATTSATAAGQQPAAPTPGKHVRAVPPLDSQACLRDTGSHIPARAGQCLPVAGRSYTRKDIQRTGALTLGQALQTLDPSVTVHGH